MDVFGMTDVRNDTFLETPKTIFPTKKHYWWLYFNLNVLISFLNNLGIHRYEGCSNLIRNGEVVRVRTFGRTNMRCSEGHILKKSYFAKKSFIFTLITAQYFFPTPLCHNESMHILTSKIQWEITKLKMFGHTDGLSTGF